MKLIDNKQLKEKLRHKEHFLLVDVRETEEYDAGHIPGSILIPWHTIAEKIAGIKKEREIVLYCQTGPRSFKAAKSLEDLGYKNVNVLSKGFEEWLNN